MRHAQVELDGISPGLRPGAIGSGIAHVAARTGHAVYLYDMNADALDAFGERPAFKYCAPWVYPDAVAA